MKSENKLLIKNSAFLYSRLAINMLVALYTTRLLLKALEVDDYGTYNVVGSIVVMFNSIKGLFISSTQRFLNYEIGKDNEKNANIVFCTSINIHIIICIIFLLIVESVGIWYINTKMILPNGNLTIANIIFQFSVISSMLTILTVPYEAVLVAKQKMDIYAYLSILDVMLKLCATASLLLMPQKHRLISYVFLILLIAFIIRLISYLYCRKFNFCHYKFIKDKKTFKEMSAFAGWNFIGNMTFSLSNEGQNLILNTFFGPTANAARAIAYQIRSVSYQLTSNMNMALKPRITHLFAQGNYAEMTKLAQYALKYLMLLVVIICVPIFLYINDILIFWLLEVPEYTSVIVKCIIVMIFLKPIATVCDDVISATGNNKNYQICTSVTTFIFFMISWIYLYLDQSITSVFIIQNIGTVVNIIIIHIIIKKQNIILFDSYLKNTITNCIIPIFVCFTLAWLLDKYILASLDMNFVFKIIIIDAVIITYLLLAHTSKHERNKVLQFIKRRKQ